MKFGHPFVTYPGLILNCCPVGMIPTRELTPHVPISPEEIIKEGLELAQKGAAILHLHARDDQGKPTWSKAVYQKIISGIREKNREVILCASTSGRLWSDFQKRSAVLELTGDARPDMASLTPCSMNFPNHASVNPPDIVRDLLRKMNDCGIKPELEVFDTGMMSIIHTLRKEGLVHDRPYINILLGNLGTAAADLGALSLLADQAEKDSIIAVSGIGRAALPVHMTALAAGLHVRFGLEDALYMDLDKKTLATNFSLLERLTDLSRLLNRPIASPAETRTMLGI
jgi:3-keto-5-aminohexanoate cleavage enzyme